MYGFDSPVSTAVHCTLNPQRPRRRTSRPKAKVLPKSAKAQAPTPSRKRQAKAQGGSCVLAQRPRLGEASCEVGPTTALHCIHSDHTIQLTVGRCLTFTHLRDFQKVRTSDHDEKEKFVVILQGVCSPDARVHIELYVAEHAKFHSKESQLLTRSAFSFWHR